MKTLYEVAEFLHHRTCCWNHTDGCSWLYEEDDLNVWNGWAHKKYLKLAQDLEEYKNEISLGSS